MANDPRSRLDGDRDRELLQIYLLHAELADRVSQRREGANRLYMSFLLALIVFLATMARFGMGDVPDWLALGATGIIGASLSGSWLTVIRSYRQLNTGKLKVLNELEEQLPFQFFKREWELLGEGKDRKRYRKLTKVESALPYIFLAFFLGVLVISLAGAVSDFQTTKV